MVSLDFGVLFSVSKFQHLNYPVYSMFFCGQGPGLGLDNPLRSLLPSVNLQIYRFPFQMKF